jgi:cyanophycin synthetase
MRIESIRALSGPNIYSHEPVLVMRLDLEKLAGRESREFDGFNERLTELLPGLREHYCAKGRPGGFIERLSEGTFFGHIVEHVALELTELVGVGTFHGKTRKSEVPGIYNVVVAYKAEHGTRFLCELAVELVEALLNGTALALDERLAAARRLIARTEIGPSTRAIVEAAAARGIPWSRIGEASLVQLGWGVNRKHIQAAISDQTRSIAVEIAGDKELTKNLLEQAAIPVPRGVVVENENEAIAALEELNGPVVVKPLNGRQGKGVSLNLTTVEQIKQAFVTAREFSRHVIVEELLAGRNYRVLVVDGRMIAASERMPAHVVGDGSGTIARLIETVNADPWRGEGHEKPLTRIVVDSVVTEHLAKIGLTLDSVPAQGEMVILREGINLSTGGTARDVTDEVHPTVQKLCERVARVVGMDVCGVDLMLGDISQPVNQKNGGGVIEVNASPGLRMHLAPSEGRPRNVGDAIVEMLYPEGAPARIPLISITGTNGKTTVTRMIAHMISESGKNVGMTTTDGIYIDGEMVSEGDTTGPQSARAVLSDPSVEVAVLETARGGIARRGLGYDWSDISVMTNIASDHIGQDGIKSVEDIVYIKSLIAERVREGGTLVLNADDEHLSRLPEEPRVKRLHKQIVFFSVHENSLIVKRHRDIDGSAFFVRNGWIVEAKGASETRLTHVASIPVCFGGTAEFNIANSIAAIAAARAYGLTKEQIAKGMMRFGAADHNIGRTNLFRVNGSYVMLDYGHNPDAFIAICRMAGQWEDRRVTGIIGVPGDRADSVIMESGKAAANGFHKIVVKEDKDRRGRRQGEVAALLERGIREAAPDRQCTIVLDEQQAILQELRAARDGDIIVIFYEKLKPVLDLLREAGAVPVSSIGSVVRRANVVGA